tara:strand:+ start:909 stop:1349 length:441 start_codon:yes stop_codon:yes gene_type:complete
VAKIKPMNSFEQKLSQQLNSFSALSETLTLRLLELEQRVLHLEEVQSSLKDNTKKLLEESHSKVNHLQNLLELNDGIKSAPLDDPISDTSSEETHGEELIDAQEFLDPVEETLSDNQTYNYTRTNFENNSDDIEYIDESESDLLSA